MWETNKQPSARESSIPILDGGFSEARDDEEVGMIYASMEISEGIPIGKRISKLPIDNEEGNIY